MIRSTHTVDGGTVLDIQRGKMFGLNPVGSRIFALLAQGSSDSEIAKEISEAFGVSLAIAKDDLREFLEALQKHHIIEPGTTGDSH
jgi:hypothetical protein